MFKCKVCGSTGEDNFYNNNKSKCKKCVKDRVREYRDENIDKVREYDRNRPNAKERSIVNRERLSRYKESGDKRYQKNVDCIRDWCKKNRKKRNAQQRARRALYKGDLEKSLVCEHCEQETKLEGHHPDYSKPLEVVWLCSSCHSTEHKRLNKENRGS